MKIFEEYGCLDPAEKDEKAVRKLLKYSEERVYRLYRKLMRNGVSLMDAERLVMLVSGSAAQTIVNQDYTKKFKREQKLEMTKSGPTGT